MMPTDWKEIPGDSKEKYSLYLCSREWSELKRAVHQRAGGKCERCGRNPIDAVHHLTYERKYAERLEDLQANCNGCHDFTHGKSDFDPAMVVTPKSEFRPDLRIVKQMAESCRRCEELASTRTKVVFGSGDESARVMFIGEAPGADEDECGDPFVGRAGQLLNIIIGCMELSRDQVYLCNVLKCRPPGNRIPSDQECSNCKQFIDLQISAVRPEYIVCLGTIAAQAIVGTQFSIGKVLTYLTHNSESRN